MDVVSILEKMRVPVESFSMQIEAEQAEDHPKVYTKIHIVYIFKGKDLPLEKLQKAVTLLKGEVLPCIRDAGKSR